MKHTGRFLQPMVLMVLVSFAVAASWIAPDDDAMFPRFASARDLSGSFLTRRCLGIKKLLFELDQDMFFLYLNICHFIREQFPETTLGSEFLD